MSDVMGKEGGLKGDALPTLMADRQLGGAHDLPRLLERLHRRFLDVLRIELERLNSSHITPVQGLMLLTIGDRSLTVMELIERGYYLGAAAAGNLRALIEVGLVEADGQRVRRQALLRLTEDGARLCRELARVEGQHVAAVACNGRGQAELTATYQLLRRLEQSWADVIRTDAIDLNDIDGPLVRDGT